MLRNLFSGVRSAHSHEVFDQILSGGKFRLERIVSNGHASPAGYWFDQDENEWVVLLAGGAALEVAGEAELIVLQPGDCFLIPAHLKHRVAWTDSRTPTVWLALHFQTDEVV